MESLRWEPSLTISDICVATHDGVVTLSGTVPTYAEKRIAERATRRVEGVKGIAEEIEVNPGRMHQHNESEIAEAVVNSLRWHVWVPNCVQATVDDGWVTLTGSVTWDFQRNAAADAIDHLSGVIGVTNKIVITPSVKPNVIKDAIERALKRNAEIDAEHITVSAEGGDVTLTGQIGTWGQREEAMAAAWNAPGVTSVDNKLVVSAIGKSPYVVDGHRS
jgi:osmotically-inducible protein OsmY